MSYPYELFDDLVGQVLQIEDITLGIPQASYLARYRGELRGPSESAYDQLASLLKPYEVIPLFRWDENRHMVLLVPAPPKPSPSNPWINLVLAILTILSVVATEGLIELHDRLPPDPLQAISAIFAHGWMFAAALLSILACHEFGHYLMGRYHGVNVTLPYFIPLPLISLFGTLGAFINMKEPPKNRKVLLDIGIAGPLAGLVVAVPVLLLGLSMSTVGPLQAGSGVMLEGNSILYLLAKFAVFGRLLPTPSDYGTTGPLFYGLGSLFTGLSLPVSVSYGTANTLFSWLSSLFANHPLPANGLDVMLHPVAWAGWAGLLVTSLNLIPAGQLDGGHVLYVLFGRKRAQRILPVILVALVLLGMLWVGWWLWAALIFFLGRAYAEPLDQITPLDNRRKAVAILGLVVFFLTFMPVPFSII